MIVRLSAVSVSVLSVLAAAACGPAPGYYVEEPVGATSMAAPIQTTPGGVQYVEQPTLAATPQATGTEVTIEVFLEELAPYGTWSEMEPYGPVWTAADPSYEPYEKGYWAYTEYGFTWIADTEWGWATEHYGRWVWANDQWVWIPDEEWGPAWVEWRDAGTMVGWAPLGPDGWRTIPPAEQWVFVDVTYIFYEDVYTYYQPPTVVTALWGHSARVSWTTAPSGFSYCPGPSARSLADRRVTVRQRGSNEIYVGRMRPATGGRSARAPTRPRVRVRTGERPRVAVRPGDRPRVEVDSAPRPRVRVDGPGRPTVWRAPSPRPADDALTAEARRRWTRPRPPARPPARTRVIGARTPDAPQWETGTYGREASDSEVRAAVERARRYERRRQIRPTPLPARPSGPTPGVTVTHGPPAPAVRAEVSRPPPRPPVGPAGTVTASPRTPNVAPRAPAIRPPPRRPVAPSVARRPMVPSRPAVRAPTPRPAARSRFARPAASPAPRAAPSFGRATPRPPAARPSTPTVRTQGPAVRAPNRPQSPGVRVTQQPSMSSNRRLQRPQTRHVSPMQRRAAPPVGRVPNLATGRRP